MTNSINGEAITIPTIAESWRVPTEAIQEAVDEAIGQLPPVNDATLTIKQNGTAKGTFTANDADDTIIELQDTTYTNFTGTDGTSAGSAGLVPAPSATDADKFLKSDGTWAEGGTSAVLYDGTGQNTDGAMTQKATTDALGGKQNSLTAGTNISISSDVISATDTTYSAGTGLSLTGTEFSANTTVLATQTDLSTGLATKQNALTAGSNVQINNDTISATDTTYSDFTGTDGTSAGTAGLVPAPAIADAGKYLKADGSWDTVSGGIPTDAKFWGQSYDSVNNRVQGDFILSTSYIEPWASANIGMTFDGAGNPLFINGGTRITLRNPSQGNKVLEIRGGAAGKYIQFYAVYPSGTLGVKGVTDPTDPQDAATKNYVDSIYPVGAVFTSTSATAPTIAGGTWAEIGTQTVGSSTVHYYERTA